MLSLYEEDYTIFSITVSAFDIEKNNKISIKFPSTMEFLGLLKIRDRKRTEKSFHLHSHKPPKFMYDMEIETFFYARKNKLSTTKNECENKNQFITKA
jgi:hypothetical protein